MPAKISLKEINPIKLKDLLAQTTAISRQQVMWLLFYFAASGLLYLCLPVLVQELIDTAMLGVVRQQIIFLTVCTATVMTLLMGISLLQYHFVEYMIRQVFVHVTHQITSYIIYFVSKWKQKTSNCALSDLDSGGLDRINRFMELVLMQKSLPKILVDGLSSLLQVFLCLLILAFYNWLIWLASIAFISVVIFMMWRHARDTLLACLSESDAKYDLFHDFQKIVTSEDSSTESAKAFIEHSLVTYLRSRDDSFRELRVHHIMLSMLQLMITAMLLGLGTHMILNEMLTVGQFVAIEIVISFMAIALSKLTGMVETTFDLIVNTYKMDKYFSIGSEK